MIEGIVFVMFLGIFFSWLIKICRNISLKYKRERDYYREKYNELKTTLKVLRDGK